VRPYQAATAAVFVLIAAVAMFDTRGGALPDPTGIAPGGLRGGWYPFWSAAIVAAAGLFVLYRTLTTPQAAEGAFQGRAAVLDVARFILPMLVATFLMQDKWLGFYIGSAVFIAYYAGLTARYRWYWALLAGAAIPVALYLIFEVGFRAPPFPKSFLYPGFPF
jgi:hypothetical protein